MTSFFKPLGTATSKVPQCLLCACKKMCAVGQNAGCVSVKPPPLDARYDYKEAAFAACLTAATAKLKAGV